MSTTDYSITYPRRRLARSAVRGGGRLLLSLAFQIRALGRQHFPQGGPLIIVGKHVAVMESALMTILTPWQVEFLGAADIPHERSSQFMINLSGASPVRRYRFAEGGNEITQTDQGDLRGWR